MPNDEIERWTQQLRKGSTRLAVLQLVGERDRYGYEIVSTLKTRTHGALALAEGNVYPALHALEAEGVIASYWQEVEPGVPPRKYYRITPNGTRLRQQLIDAWNAYVHAIGTLLQGEQPNETHP